MPENLNTEYRGKKYFVNIFCKKMMTVDAIIFMFDMF